KGINRSPSNSHPRKNQKVSIYTLFGSCKQPKKKQLTLTKIAIPCKKSNFYLQIWKILCTFAAQLTN
ncbi:MAG: hypothetical protein MJZ79_08445, partial [Paludibacteraceae bacterium]|nr:hypothetical protein [Paludibacteraceae bacterium]